MLRNLAFALATASLILSCEMKERDDGDLAGTPAPPGIEFAQGWDEILVDGISQRDTRVKINKVGHLEISWNFCTWQAGEAVMKEEEWNEFARLVNAWIKEVKVAEPYCLDMPKTQSTIDGKVLLRKLKNQEQNVYESETLFDSRWGTTGKEACTLYGDRVLAARVLEIVNRVAVLGAHEGCRYDPL